VKTDIAAPRIVVTPGATRSVAKRLELPLGRDWRIAYPFLAPMVLLMVGLIGWPMLQAIYMSFTRTVGLNIGPFVGLANYIDTWRDPEFHDSIAVTVKFTFFSVFSKFWIGLAAALVLNSSKIKYRNLLTALVLLPWIVPEVVTALAWRAIYDPLFGGLNHLLIILGITKVGIAWLGDPHLALPAVVVVNVWKGIPFFVIVLLSGLKAIDQEQYDAASIDGATSFRRFLHITLPGLRYVIIVCTLLSSIWTFNGFGLVYLLTSGGPGDATELYSIFAYRDISGFRYSAGTAVALSMAPVLALFIIFLGRYMMSGGKYEEVGETPKLFSWILWPFSAVLGLIGTVVMAIVDVVESLLKAVRGGRTASAKSMSNRAATRTMTLVGYAYLGLLLLFILFPFYWCVITSFKTDNQISDGTHVFWPEPWTITHFKELLFDTSFPIWFKNTVLVAIVATIVSVACASLGAYALTRLRWRGARTLSVLVLVTYLVPGVMMVIPMYKILTQLHVINALSGLMLTYPAFIMPFATWLLMGYYRSIPEEMEEAAVIDGCTRFQAYRKVVLPLTAPALLATALFAITNSWNEFLFAFVFITREVNKTLPVGLAQMVIGDVFPWGQMMAAALMMAVPVVIIYTLGQRVMVGGLTAGAVKQ
jgi:multiple sugar transport system permease protein